jgi:hypothetical protein
VIRSRLLLNEVREWRNRVDVGYSIGQVLPKGDSELSTGPLQAHEGIPTASPPSTYLLKNHGHLDAIALSSPSERALRLIPAWHVHATVGQG